MSHRAAATLLAAILCLASEAAAAPPPAILVAPSGRPFEAYGGLGGAWNVRADAGHQFKLVEGFAWHFLGQAHGPAIALELQQGFGGAVTFVVGPRFKWDFQILRALAIYVAPFLQLGYLRASSSSAFNLQFGGETKLILAQRAAVFWRPFQLNFGFLGDRTSFAYDLIIGGGVIF
jgi:hypothetical protein